MLKKVQLLAVIILSLAFVGVGLALAQEGDPERGANLYVENCAVCHGADAKGRIGVNLSQDFPSINVDAFLKEAISNGVSGSRMPAWSQANGGPLSEQDIADLAAYVAGLAGGSEPVAPAPTFVPQPITPAPGVTGDPAAGSVIFAQNCVVCHGEQGRGRIGANLTKNWPSINPSAYVRATVESGIDGSLMPAWLDANGGPLTAADIENVSAFIVSLGQAQPSSTATSAPTATGPIGFGTGMAILAIIVVLIGAALVIYYRRA